MAPSVQREHELQPAKRVQSVMNRREHTDAYGCKTESIDYCLQSKAWTMAQWMDYELRV